MSKMNTDWIHDAKWGVFTHWCGGAGSSDEWNARVDKFDVDLLARQLAEVKAGYYFITLGQCSGYYCAPNDTYDRIVRRDPSHCSRRDLISDIADALEGHGIRVMVYLAAVGPLGDPYATRKLALICDQTLGWGVEGNRPRPGLRLTDFQRYWLAICRDWSLRFGRKVHGWWLDACCYWLEQVGLRAGEISFKEFAEALKAGNADSIVAFNGGPKTPVVTTSEYEDFTAGELADMLPLGCRTTAGELRPITRFIDGTQYHVLMHMGTHWGSSPALFPAELVVGYTKYVNQHGGVVTWDAGLDDVGNMQQDHFQQMKALCAATR